MLEQRVSLITLGVADLARARALCAAPGWGEAGASQAAAPAPTPSGGCVGYFADPDGHVWEVAHAPTPPLGADGSLTPPGAAA